MIFTEKKFLNLPQSSKHSKCKKLVRKLYLSLLNQSNFDHECLSLYRDFESWMDLSPAHLNLEALSDRYHYHHNQANFDTGIDDLLPCNPLLDSCSTKAFLDIDIYLDNLRSLHNIGSIIRTIEAFRLGTLCSFSDFDFLNHPKLKKTSMHTENTIQTKKVEGFNKLRSPIIGLEITPKSTNLFDFTFPKSFSLIVGNEEYGLSETTLNNCDHLLHIPLYGQKNSLNVSNAFAIAAAIISNQLQT